LSNVGGCESHDAHVDGCAQPFLHSGIEMVLHQKFARQNNKDCLRPFASQNAGCCSDHPCHRFSTAARQADVSTPAVLSCSWGNHSVLVPTSPSCVDSWEQLQFFHQLVTRQWFISWRDHQRRRQIPSKFPMKGAADELFSVDWACAVGCPVCGGRMR
jgi:hypothetical protein